MPVGTIDTSHFERKELKSLKGAYIMVRPLPYGKKLDRRDKATRMFMESEASSGKSKKAVEKEIQRFELETLNKWARIFDFSYCIGEHNITDANEQVLDFSNPITFNNLNPLIGDEIEEILDAINNAEEEDDEETFTPSPESSSKDAETD